MNLQLAKNSYAYFVFHAGFFSETALGYRGAYFKQLLNKYLKWNGFFVFLRKTYEIDSISWHFRSNYFSQKIFFLCNISFLS